MELLVPLAYVYLHLIGGSLNVGGFFVVPSIYIDIYHTCHDSIKMKSRAHESLVSKWSELKLDPLNDLLVWTGSSLFYVS